MVLELVPPHGTTLDDLRPLAPVFLSYVLSFAILAIWWNNHHHLFQAVRAIDGRVLWANMLLLFFLSLFPFTTAWMGESAFASQPVALYGADRWPRPWPTSSWSARSSRSSLPNRLSPWPSAATRRARSRRSYMRSQSRRRRGDLDRSRPLRLGRADVDRARHADRAIPGSLSDDPVRCRPPRCAPRAPNGGPLSRMIWRSRHSDSNRGPAVYECGRSSSAYDSGGLTTAGWINLGIRCLPPVAILGHRPAGSAQGSPA